METLIKTIEKTGAVLYSIDGLIERLKALKEIKVKEISPEYLRKMLGTNTDTSTGVNYLCFDELIHARKAQLYDVIFTADNEVTVSKKQH